ncbi:MAG: hypothetical protein AB1405_18240, partial [Bdellovibrionota bacterium]
ARARLELLSLDAGSLQARFSGDLGGEEKELDMEGELIAPAAPGGEAPLLPGVVHEGDAVRLPVKIQGTWASPRVSLAVSGEGLREAILKVTPLLGTP